MNTTIRISGKFMVLDVEVDSESGFTIWNVLPDGTRGTWIIDASTVAYEGTFEIAPLPRAEYKLDHE